MLHPTADSYDRDVRRDNDRSCVLRVARAGGSVLLTGDIEARASRRCSRAGAPLAADVLLVPHHGSRTSSTEPFPRRGRRRGRPSFTVGYRNRFGHPRAGRGGTICRPDVEILRTDRTGALTVTLDERRVSAIAAYRETAARGTGARPTAGRPR